MALFRTPGCTCFIASDDLDFGTLVRQRAWAPRSLGHLPGLRTATDTDLSAPAISSAATAAVMAWHRTVQSLPLFAAAAAGVPVACEISAVDGVLHVGYRFGDGTRIEANRDPAIEYVSVALQFAPAKRLDVQPVLAATERALFGTSGCGINWTRPSGAPATSASAIATQFEGASCNCRALARRSVDGAAISAGLSATC